MGKKFGINSKSEEARARVAATKQATKEKQDREKEDAKWAETDKKVLAKEGRKKEKDDKKVQAAQRKAENKAIEQKEQQELSKKYGKPKDTKVTRAIIEEQRAKEIAEKQKAEKKKEEPEKAIEPNINQILAAEREEMESKGGELLEAQSLDDAVGQLNVNDKEDKHPEKRMKAAYLAYEEVQLPILKQENPTLKLSQLKELLWKQWQKAPENPMNQQ